MDPRGAPTDAVVYVESLPADADAAIPRAGALPQLAQKGQRFVPRVLPVAVGTTVDFPNMDPIFHNVFSLSPVKRFDLGRYPRGHSKRVTFGTPGLVNVFCDIHSSMAAYVLVLPHHAFAQPDSDGAFTLPDLPSGHYVLHVWHPDAPAATRSVDLPASGDVSLEVTL
jgi:plastocyanin